MSTKPTFAFARVIRIGALALAPVFLLAAIAATFAEEKLSEPIYRVANETPAVQPAATALTTAPAATTTTTTATAPATTAKAPLDFTLQPGEHKLAPVVRVVKACQEEIDRNVRDYSCTLVKRERVDGELGEYQHIFVKVMHNPFSIYMSFLKPFAGREVLYIDGQNDGKMVVLEAGYKRMLGKVNLDPTGTIAMKGQKHCVTDAGIRNLTIKLSKMWESEMKFGECDVVTNADSKINGRSATLVQVTHPVPRQDFRFHIARLFFDNELQVPIHFDAFLWPEKEGDKPALEESFTYQNLKLNNGFTARDFDANNNPDIFKK